MSHHCVPITASSAIILLYIINGILTNTYFTQLLLYILVNTQSSSHEIFLEKKYISIKVKKTYCALKHFHTKQSSSHENRKRFFGLNN